MRAELLAVILLAVISGFAAAFSWYMALKEFGL